MFSVYLNELLSQLTDEVRQVFVADCYSDWFRLVSRNYIFISVQVKLCKYQTEHYIFVKPCKLFYCVVI